MLNKQKIKEKLERERDALLEQLKEMGKLDPETGEWEATPEEIDVPESDQNDMADRFEDFEAKSANMEVLEERLNQILLSLEKINDKDFGTCRVCKKIIEEDRLEVNPSAETCKAHLEN